MASQSDEHSKDNSLQSFKKHMLRNLDALSPTTNTGNNPVITNTTSQQEMDAEVGDAMEPELFQKPGPGPNSKATTTQQVSTREVVLNKGGSPMKADSKIPSSSESSLLSSISNESLHGRQTSHSFVANTSTSDENASDNVIQPSPRAYNVDVVVIPPSQDEEDSDIEKQSNICTPSEKLANLHFSGQKSTSKEAESPPHDYEPKAILISSPSQSIESDAEQPMDTSDNYDVMAETEPYFSKEDNDAFEIPKWQQVLNEEQLCDEAVQTGSSENSLQSESPDAVDVERAVSQSGQFQAWQTSLGSSVPEGTRSRSTSAGKGISSLPTTSAIKENPVRTRSTSTPPKKLISTRSRGHLEDPADTQNLLAEVKADAQKLPPKQTSGNEMVKSQVASLRLHYTETAQDSSLAEPQLKSKTSRESVQAKDGAVDAIMHEETDGEEDLFDDENNDEDDEQPKISSSNLKQKDAIGKQPAEMHHNVMADCEVVAASQDWYLHFTQTQNDTEGVRSQDHDGVKDSHKQGAGSEISQSVFQKPKNVTTDLPISTTNLSPVEDYPNNNFVKNANIAHSSRENSGTGFHFSLPNDESLKPVTEVIACGGEIIRKGLQSPRHHSTPILEKEESIKEVENTDDPMTKIQVEAANERPTTSVLVLGLETDHSTDSTPIFHVARPSDSGELISIAKESPKKTTSVFSKVQQAKEAGEGLDDGQDQSSNSCHYKNKKDLISNESSPSVFGVESVSGDNIEMLSISEDTEILAEVGENIMDTEISLRSENIDRPSGNQNDVGKEHKIVCMKKSVGSSVQRSKSASSARRRSPRKQGDLQKERRDPFEFSDSQCYGTPTPARRQQHPPGESVSTKRRKLLDLPLGKSPETRVSGKGLDNSSKTVQSISVTPRSTGKRNAKRKTPTKTSKHNRSKSHAKSRQCLEKTMVDTQSTITQSTTSVEQHQPGNAQVDNSQAKSNTKKVTWHTKITTTTTTIVQRHILEKAMRDGVVVEVKQRTETDVPIVKVNTEYQEQSPMSPSRTTSSFSSGDLGDVSSLSTSKSSGSGSSFNRSISNSSLPKFSSNVDSVATFDNVSARVAVPVRDSSEKLVSSVTNKRTVSGLHDTVRRSCGNQEESHAGGSMTRIRGLSDKSTKTVAFTEPSTSTHVTRSRRLGRRLSEDIERTENTSLTSLKSKKKPVSNERNEAEVAQEEGTTDASSSSKKLENILTRKKNTSDGTISGGSKSAAESGDARPTDLQELAQEVVGSEEKHPDTSRTTVVKRKENSSSPAPPRRCSPRKAAGIHSTEESSGDLTEPPDPEIGPYLLPGVRVLARWRDGYYYPGAIDKEASPNRFSFCFDDGDKRIVGIQDILHKAWLPKGQPVLAESTNEFYSPGKVIGYFRDDDCCGYIVENVNTGESQRYPRSKVILTKEQAMPLLQFSASTDLNTGLNLDNIVCGKRLRGKTTTSENTSSGTSGGEKAQATKEVIDKKVKGSPASTPLRKRSRSQLIDQNAPLIEKPYTPTHKRRKTSIEDGDSTSSTLVHTSTVMGPLPHNKSLFKGIHFLITQGDVVKRSANTSDSLNESNSEDEMQMRFNRDYASKQIMVGGGNVLKSYDSSQKCSGKVYLIANTHCRTKKYFQALAAGLTCISHIWLRDSCRENKLQDFQSYVLHAGESVEEKGKLKECTKGQVVLRGMHIMVVSEVEETKNTWVSILHAARCDVVSKLPSNKNPADSSVAFTCDVIVTDPTCPKSIRDKADELGIPVVSTEWVIQCLINGYRPDYNGHVSYTWNYRKKH